MSKSQAVFGSGVEWHGEIDDDRFVVEEILDHGVPESHLTGLAPQIAPVPLAEIRALGGKVLPLGLVSKQPII